MHTCVCRDKCTLSLLKSDRTIIPHNRRDIRRRTGDFTSSQNRRLLTPPISLRQENFLAKKSNNYEYLSQLGTRTNSFIYQQPYMPASGHRAVIIILRNNIIHNSRNAEDICIFKEYCNLNFTKSYYIIYVNGATY